mgnify:CR=1 FL=1|tara:strand:- start:460 stop:1656 length:1197 start_codon:yes stop_codon:yes gene_type:complete
MKKKRIIVIFKPINKKDDFYKKFRQNLEKKFSKVLIYPGNDTFIEANTISREKINKIKKKYDFLEINLSLNSLIRVNNFLNNIKSSYKNKEIFISPLFISGVITEEEFIFFELSKIYGMKFLRPELSFIKNRYILAKNLFKHIYEIKNKTQLTKKKFIKFRSNYILSLENFSKSTIEKRKKKLINYLYQFYFFLFRLFYKFEFNKKTKDYALIILGNDSNLNKLAENIKMKYFVKKFFSFFNYKIVFLLHPYTNIIYFLKNCIRNKDNFFNHNRIIFLQKPNNLNEIIKNSKFVIHLTSSLSAQLLFYEKKILCLGKNIMYIDDFNSNVIKYNYNNLRLFKKKNDKKSFEMRNNFLNKILKNSVNNNGEFKINLHKKYYSSRLKINENKIILNLLNSI